LLFPNNEAPRSNQSSVWYIVSIQLLPVACHPERSEARHQTVLGEGSNNLEIPRLSASE